MDGSGAQTDSSRFDGSAEESNPEDQAPHNARSAAPPPPGSPPPRSPSHAARQRGVVGLPWEGMDFFSGSARPARKVALGGASRGRGASASRAEILERNRRERERRAEARARGGAAARVQARWRGAVERDRAREAMKAAWVRKWGAHGERATPEDAAARGGELLRDALFFARGTDADGAAVLARCAQLCVLPAFASGASLPLLDSAGDVRIGRLRAERLLCGCVAALHAAAAGGGAAAEWLLAPLPPAQSAAPPTAEQKTLQVLATAAVALAQPTLYLDAGARPAVDRLMAMTHPPGGCAPLSVALAGLVRLGDGAAPAGDCLAARVVASVCERYAASPAATAERGRAAAAAFAAPDGLLRLRGATRRLSTSSAAVSRALLIAAVRVSEAVWNSLDCETSAVALGNLADACAASPRQMHAADARAAADALHRLLARACSVGAEGDVMDLDEKEQGDAMPWGVQASADSVLSAQLETLAADDALAPLVSAASAASGAGELNPAEGSKPLCSLVNALFARAGPLAPRLVNTLAYKMDLLASLWNDVLSRVPGHVSWASAALGGAGKEWVPSLVAVCEIATRTLASADAEELRGNMEGGSRGGVLPVSALHDSRAPHGGLIGIVRSAAWDMLWAPTMQQAPTDALAIRASACRLLRVAYDRLTSLELVPPSAFHATVLRSQAGLERFNAEVQAALWGTAGAGAFEAAAAAAHDTAEDDGNSEDDALAANRMLSGARVRAVLLSAPCLVPFSARAAAFHTLVCTDRESKRGRANIFGHVMGRGITVRRGNLLEDGMNELDKLGDAVKGLIRVQFVDITGEAEAGIDGGGLFKDFLEELLLEGFSDKRGLFRANARNELYPDPAAGTSSVVLRLYEFLGKMVGKAVYEGILLELPLAQHFLRKVLPGKLGVSGAADLASLDAELDANLRYVRRAGAATEDLGLTFAATTANGREVGLLPGGRGAQVPVTEANAALYVHLMAHYRLNAETRLAADAFGQGFRTLITPEWASLFNPKELQELVSGKAGRIDVDDMRNFTVYASGFHEDHPIVLNFWSVVESMSAKEQRMLVKFVTSCSRAPLLGFKALEPRFCLQMAGHVGEAAAAERLPTAATCMNLLKLPPYATREALAEKLVYAISQGSGFHLS